MSLWCGVSAAFIDLPLRVVPALLTNQDLELEKLLCCTRQWSQHNTSRIGDCSFHSKIQLLSGSILYFSFSRQILTLFKAVAVLSTCCLPTRTPLPSTAEELVVGETKGMRGLREVGAIRLFSFGWGFISI